MLGSGRNGERIVGRSLVDRFDGEGFKANGAELQATGVRRGRDFVAREIGSFFRSPRHGDVDVLKDLAGGDAEDAFKGFDQVIPFSATVLAAEVIGEAESVVESLGFDQEAGAVGLPFHRFHGAPIPVLRLCFLND